MCGTIIKMQQNFKKKLFQLLSYFSVNYRGSSKRENIIKKLRGDEKINYILKSNSYTVDIHLLKLEQNETVS